MKELKIKNLRVYNKPTGKLLRKSFTSVLLATSLVFQLSGCSVELLNKKYKFENAVLTNNGNSVVIPIKNWRDYQGEAIQIVTEDGMAILSSSYFLSLLKGSSAKDFAFNYANGMTDLNGTMSLYLNPNEPVEGNNFLTFDTVKKFDKAIIIQGDRAVIYPIAKWWDFDGEQIQVLTPDNAVILSSNYNTILVSDSQSKKKASDLAQMIVGEKGNVYDYAKGYTLEENNYGYWDFNNLFNEAVMLNEEANTIVPIKKWTDYDGEQFQISIFDGPIAVCSSFNTILVNDTISTEITAELISEALNSNTINYTKEVENKLGKKNSQFWDSNNSFQNAQIVNGTSGVMLPIQKWDDYDGEQLQFQMNNGITLLSSSIDSRMFSRGGESITSNMLSDAATENYFNLDPKHSITTNNQVFWDTKYTFPYALVVRDDSIIIFSVAKWADYAGGEKFRLTLSDLETVFLTTAYDTKLVNLGNSGISIQQFAEMFNDGNKKIVDLTDDNGLNLGTHDSRLFSSEIEYNYAIAFNREVAVIMPIDKWYRYNGSTDGDGDYTDYTEQIQIRLVGQIAVYSDVTNIKLVKSNDPEYVEALARAHMSDDAIVNNISKENDFVPKYVLKKK